MRRSFGKVLRELRKSRGISQETLALEAGIDRSYVGLLERDAYTPTIKMLISIGKVLKVKPSEMLSRMGI